MVTGRDPEVCKWPEGVWARLGLLLIIVVLVKGLLIGCAIRCKSDNTAGWMNAVAFTVENVVLS